MDFTTSKLVPVLTFSCSRHELSKQRSTDCHLRPIYHRWEKKKQLKKFSLRHSPGPSITCSIPAGSSNIPLLSCISNRSQIALASITSSVLKGKEKFVFVGKKMGRNHWREQHWFDSATPERASSARIPIPRNGKRKGERV